MPPDSTPLVSEWLPAAGQLWPEPRCSSDPAAVCSAMPSPALPDRQPCLHPGPRSNPTRGSTIWSVSESGWRGAPSILVGSGFHAKEGVHRGTASPCSVSLPLSPRPPIFQPWLTVPWRSCCSASPHPCHCCCFTSWDLVYCGPCWASWGPWPWAPFVGMHCYTCCHMYVDPLPYSPAPVGGRPLISRCSQSQDIPPRQPTAAFW